jgi:hypothetical protein
LLITQFPFQQWDCEPARQSAQRGYPYMMQWPFSSRRAFLLALLGVVAAGCNSPPDDASPQAVESQLAGTWLREYEEDGVKIRRVLVLQAGGQFQELAKAAAPDATAAEHSHAGEWLFDGTNLKRRYTRMDGRQPSAPTIPYATFEIRFASRNEFIGLDRVHKREVRYRRVDDGTLP